jgi:peptide-methionine (S)-S-oxide reductase
MRIAKHCFWFLALGLFSGCGDKHPAQEPGPSKEVSLPMPPKPGAANSDPTPGAKVETATLGAGCFWCVEAVYQELKGVISVESGYSGGQVDHPTYKDVCTGRTGHAEVCQITFDPAVLSFKDVLEVFWKTHDPTTLNRQGNDHGTQYRSAIFYHSEEQRALAERLKSELDKSGAWDRPIVTEISPFTKFWKAEEYHQNYFRNHPDQGYCAYVIAPKMEKFRKVFGDKLK